MAEHSELKRLAEACAAAGEYSPGDAWEEDRSYGPAEVAFLAFAPAATPMAMLALIADLEEARNGMKHSCAIRLKKEIERLEGERDQLKAENERLKTLRSTTERDLAQELEVWRHGPSCWNCGDTGDVHDMVGEWRGQCDCNAAKLIEVASERDQLKADNEALRKDAERYRWLRIDDWWRSPMCVIRNPKDQAKLGSDCPSSDRLDAAIDAAIGKGEQS